MEARVAVQAVLQEQARHLEVHHRIHHLTQINRIAAVLIPNQTQIQIQETLIAQAAVVRSVVQVEAQIQALVVTLKALRRPCNQLRLKIARQAK